MHDRFPNVALRAALACTVIVTCFSASPALAEEPETFTVEFAPEDGSRWRCVTTDRRMQDLGTVAPISERVVEFVVELSYDAQEDGTWHVVQSTVENSMSQNGEPQETAAMAIVREQEITVVVDSTGEAIDARGFRELMRRYERDLTPADYQAINRNMNPRSMAVGEISRWNRPLEGLRGESFTVGETIAVRSAANFQDTKIELKGTLEVGDWTTIGDERGVTFTYRLDETGEALRRAGELERTIVLHDADEVEPTNHGLEIDAEIVVVVQPSTGQVLYEVLETTTLVPVQQGALDKARLEDEVRSRWTRLPSGESR